MLQKEIAHYPLESPKVQQIDLKELTDGQSNQPTVILTRIFPCMRLEPSSTEGVFPGTATIAFRPIERVLSVNTDS